MQNWNHASSGGKDAPLEIVLLPNGQDPTRPPVGINHYCLFPITENIQHNLPALTSVRALDQLGHVLRDQYHAAYYPNPPAPDDPAPNAAERAARLRWAIGLRS